MGGSHSTLNILLDILIVTIFIYNILKILQDVGGLPLAIRFISIAFFLSLISWVSKTFHILTFTGWVSDKILAILIISVPIIFQPEFRRALQKFQLLKLPSHRTIGKKAIDEILIATEWLKANGYGALIIIEKDDVIGDVESGRGVILDALPKAKLIETIFYPGSPLHDGAVIINQQGRLWAAGYVIPIPEDISETIGIYSHFGTRHTAALAITREKDVVAIIVSEERKWVKIAYGGKMLDDTFGASPREILFKLLIKKDHKQYSRRRSIDYSNYRKSGRNISSENHPEGKHETE